MHSELVTATGHVASVAMETPRLPEPAKAEDIPEEVTLITTGTKKLSRRAKAIDEDEPLIDTTVAIPKKSKKTERAIKRFMRKQQKAARRRGPATFSDLPAELLEEILSYLRASDTLQLLTLNRGINTFITTNESAIARSITTRRYSILSKCFPLPLPFSAVPPEARPALLSEGRQRMLGLPSKHPYQHIQRIDPHKICICMSCVLAWNNLNMLVDLAHWQKNLNSREPIPMIPRGQSPSWNKYLLTRNAERVEQAMLRPLFYTLILQHHLETTVATISRTLRGQKTVHPKRVFYLTKSEVDGGIETDAFLAKSGPENHEFPYHRDNYYNLNAYIPNRKWVRSEERWVYYAAGLHERDLAWIQERFGAEVSREVGGSEQGQQPSDVDSLAAAFLREAALSGVTAADEKNDGDDAATGVPSMATI